MNRKLLLIVAAAGMAVLPAATADARPKLGTYQCQDPYAPPVPGPTLRIRTKHRYRTKGALAGSSETGKGRFKVKGKRIRFKTGPWNGYRGVIGKSKEALGKPAISIYKKGQKIGEDVPYLVCDHK